MYKHYLKVNESNEIIGAFSDAFKPADEDSLLYKKTKDRHFNLVLQDSNGFNKYNYTDNKIVLIPEPDRGTPEERLNINLAIWEREIKTAYNRESDPLFIEIMRENNYSPTAEQIAPYETKVQEIKTRYPKPTE